MEAASEALTKTAGLVKQTFWDMASSVRQDVMSLVHTAEHLIAAGISGIGMLISFGLLSVAVALGIALLLHTLRGGFFTLAPSIAKHSKIWDVAIVSIGDVFVAVIDFLLLLYTGLEDLVDVIRKVPSDANIHHVKMVNLSTAQLRRDMLNYTQTCANITGPVELVALATKLGVGDLVCPYVRATWPLGAVGRWARTCIGWMAPPSAPNGGNCQFEPGAPGWPCVIINCSVMAFDLLMIYAVVAIMGLTGIARTVSLAVKLVKTVGELLSVFFMLLKQIVSELCYGVKYVETAVHHYDYEAPPPDYATATKNDGKRRRGGTGSMRL